MFFNKSLKLLLYRGFQIQRRGQLIRMLVDATAVGHPVTKRTTEIVKWIDNCLMVTGPLAGWINSVVKFHQRSARILLCFVCCLECTRQCESCMCTLNFRWTALKLGIENSLFILMRPHLSLFHHVEFLFVVRFQRDQSYKLARLYFIELNWLITPGANVQVQL